MVILGNLLVAKNQTLETKITNLTMDCATLNISWNIAKLAAKFVALDIKLLDFPQEKKGWFFTKSRELSFRLGRWISGKEFMKVFKSESVPEKKITEWKTPPMRVSRLCKDDL